MDTSFTGTLPFFPSHTYTNPFPRNQLTLIPNFDKENDDPVQPSSLPYDPKQAIRDHKAYRLLPTLSAPPTPTSTPMTLVSDSLADPIIIDIPTP